MSHVIINILQFSSKDLKRNLGSLKNSPVHGAKTKRDLAYNDYPGSNSEILEPVYQASPIDYEELNEVMNQLYPYYDNDIHEDKRFLGLYTFFIKLLHKFSVTIEETKMIW